MKKQSFKLIAENLKQLADIPKIISNIENTEFELMPERKNSLIRFHNERKIILLNEIETLKMMYNE